MCVGNAMYGDPVFANELRSGCRRSQLKQVSPLWDDPAPVSLHEMRQQSYLLWPRRARRRVRGRHVVRQYAGVGAEDMVIRKGNIVQHRFERPIHSEVLAPFVKAPESPAARD